jgi:hypothetical protein
MDDVYLVYNRKGTFWTDKGNLVGLSMKLWHLPHIKAKEFPEGYKLS